MMFSDGSLINIGVFESVFEGGKGETLYQLMINIHSLLGSIVSHFKGT